MGLIPKINLFVEERVGVRSYPAKVSLLFALLVALSLVTAFVIDVAISFGDIKKQVETASLRAAKFRTTAISNVMEGLFRADRTLVALYRAQGKKVFENLLGPFIECAVFPDGKKGSLNTQVLSEALKVSEGKENFFFFLPDSWKGIAIIRDGKDTFAFCHDVAYIESILSKRLGAIAKYGAEFRFVTSTQTPEAFIKVVYPNEFSNARMVVTVPFGNFVKTLLADRVVVYIRLLAIFSLILFLAYFPVSRLLSYPIRRLRQTIEELERGNYDANMEDLLSAADEFGATARVLHRFSQDTKTRLQKLELIVETALYTVDSLDELPDFAKRVLDRINTIFNARLSLLILEDRILNREIVSIYSGLADKNRIRELIEFFSEEGLDVIAHHLKLECKVQRGENFCRSLMAFKVSESVFGGLVFEFDHSVDAEDEGYLRVLAQHIAGTVRLCYLASTDSLTGIPNRRMLDHDLRKLARLASEWNTSLSLIMIDIDDFKYVNDTYGHRVGDEVLKRIATVIRENVGQTDSVYRYGGEEFTVLSVGTSKEEAVKLAERIREAIKREKVWIDRDRYVSVTVSVGVASLPEDTEDPEELLVIADIGLYRAKKNGKDRTIFLRSKEDVEFYKDLFGKGMDIAELLEKGLFTYELEPIYYLQSGELFGYELLFRAIRDGKPEHVTEFFLNIADVSILEEIDLGLVKMLPDILKRYPTERLFVNISPKTLERGRIFTLLEELEDSLRKRILIEVTEREPFRDRKEGLELLKKLKEMGYGIVIDDFGSGTSSLLNLKEWSGVVGFVKIDGVFVRNSGIYPEGRDLLEIIRTAADRFGIECIAEQIEREEDLRAVKEAGIKLGQGRFFSTSEAKVLS